MKDIFQDPNYKRHDNFGYNFRMPEVAAALGLAQTEKIDYFINLRINIANLYEEATKNCDYLIPQKKTLNTFILIGHGHVNLKTNKYLGTSLEINLLNLEVMVFTQHGHYFTMKLFFLQ